MCLGRLCGCYHEHSDDDGSQSGGPDNARPIELTPETEANRRRQQETDPENEDNAQDNQAKSDDQDNDGAASSILDEDYPPLPSSASGSHTGYTPEVSAASSVYWSSSNEDLHSLPASTRSSHTKVVPHTGEHDSEEEAGYRANNPSEYESQSHRSSASSRTKRTHVEAHQDDDNASWATSEPSERASKRSRSSQENLSSDDPEEGMRPSEEQIARYRELGVRYQAWIEDASAPGCSILPATLTAAQMFEARRPNAWELTESHHTDRPAILDAGFDFADTELQTPHWRAITATKWDIMATDYNFYDHINGLGIIAGRNISRLNGPHWNEVAKALYEVDFPISTLRHIAFCNVVNEETAPCVKYVLYPRHGTQWLNSRRQPRKSFERGTRSYEELLGTQLGKAAASLVISAFPRGSMMISRIVAWPDMAYYLQMRFEIAPLSS